MISGYRQLGLGTLAEVARLRPGRAILKFGLRAAGLRYLGWGDDEQSWNAGRRHEIVIHRLLGAGLGKSRQVGGDRKS